MATKSGIGHTPIFQWCWTLSVPWGSFPLARHFPVRSSVIIYLHDTKTPYPRVARVHHIASSGAIRKYVIVGFTAQQCYEMLNEVLIVIYLSHLPHEEPSTTC